MIIVSDHIIDGDIASGKGKEPLTLVIAKFAVGIDDDLAGRLASATQCAVIQIGAATGVVIRFDVVESDITCRGWGNGDRQTIASGISSTCKVRCLCLGHTRNDDVVNRNVAIPIRNHKRNTKVGNPREAIA